MARVLAVCAALRQQRDDEVVVVDEEGRLVAARRVLPCEPLGQQLLDLRAQRAQDGREHGLDRARLEQPQRGDELRVPG